jgi:ABC-type cobalamin/Fe3+-siderophores transport system ATPase subunit
MDYPRGSEWRRWDLHIHTPFTRKNDLFTGTIDSSKTPDEKAQIKWDNFFATVTSYIGDGSDPTKVIAAIGITDYFSIENYKTVIANDALMALIPLVLPNVELRILPAATETPINLHCIFNPALSPAVIEDRFLAKLEYKHNNTPYSATRSSLIQLGKALDSSITDDFTAEKKALEQYVVNLGDLQNLFNNDKELRENSLIAVSNKSSDGASGIGNPTNDNSTADLTSLRDEVYKFADAIFTANPNDVLYFVGKKDGSSVDTVKKKCGKLMPCIHGSDAHKNDDLFEPDMKRYCWIKADPTFNGLKQLVFEPEERVQISESKPQEKPSYQVIESITIRDDRFQTEPILFNDKLTCIIGAKSSGKSILLHNLACAITPKQVEDKYEIITGGKRSDRNSKPLTLEIKPEDISVKWADGNDTDGQTIVYIPQTYLNRLADSAQETTEIDAIIEKVLLDRRDSNGRLCREKKAELISHINDVKSKNTNSILEIIRTNNRIQELAGAITELGGKAPVAKELKKLQEERDKLTKELNISDDDIKKYDDAIASIDVQNNLIEQLESEINQLSQILVVVESCETFFDFSDATKAEIQAVVETIVQEANTAWNERKEGIVKRIEEKLVASKTSHAVAVQTRDQLKGVVESSNRIKELGKRINDETEKLKSIKAKEALQGEEQKKIDVAIKDVAESYVKLREAYEAFAQYITENTADDSLGLEYSVQIPLRRDDFLAKWSEFYRGNSPQNRELIDVELFTDGLYTADLLTQIISKTLKGELTVLKAGSQAETALRGILDDWFNIKYVVQMGNDAIDVMSPGKKALVLLRLLIDLADSTCPILIDQPEDDLDNRSVFHDLIDFMEKKKVIRQIIVVTHNANVVLGADAEGVIVANQDGSDTPQKERRFEYRSGAIENDYPLYKSDNTTVEDGILNSQGIQQHICSILEGGPDAFEKRKNKYQYMVPGHQN